MVTIANTNANTKYTHTYTHTHAYTPQACVYIHTHYMVAIIHTRAYTRIQTTMYNKLYN